MAGPLRWVLVLALVGMCGSILTGHGAQAQRPVRHQTCIYDHYVLKTSKKACRPRARTYPAYITGAVERSIYDAALTFGVPYRLLFRIATCESGLQPTATNGSHFGLFQFRTDTFAQNTVLMRHFTGILAHSVWNARDSSYVAAFMFADDHHFEWTCQ